MIKPESTGRMAAQHRGDFGGAVADLGGPAAVQRLDGGTIPVTCLDGSNHALEFGKARLADVAEGNCKGTAWQRGATSIAAPLKFVAGQACPPRVR